MTNRTLDELAKEALARVNKHINRSVKRHQKEMQEQFAPRWTEEQIEKIKKDADELKKKFRQPRIAND